jgi:hypothetical protein
MTDVVRIVVREPTTVKVGAPEPTTVKVGVPGLPGPAGIGDMQKLIYDPHGYEVDVFDLGHMTGTLDAGTF